MKRVGIIGRTNVGKSTLFNRLIKQNKSIVSTIAGTTRDFVSGQISIGDEEIEIADFGGFDFGINSEKDIIEKSVQENILHGIGDLDLVLFVVDGKCELSAEDEKIAEIIRKSKKPVIVVVNKVDGKEQEDSLYDFYALGFENVIGVSAINNKNLDELILKIAEKLKLKKKKKTVSLRSDLTKIAIIGKPNVGKSSLFNELYGDTRSIVTEIAGTTRDNIDAEIELDGKKYLFIDTAGLRRKTKINEFLDRESSYKSIKAINGADIVLFVLDVGNYSTAYDIKLLSYAIKKGRPILIVVNKWDIKPADMTEGKYKSTLMADNSIFKDLPFIFVSAVKGKGMDKLVENIKQLEANLNFKIKTSALNQAIAKIIHEVGNMNQKVFYATQVSENPIELLLFINNKKFFTKKHIQIIEKKLREKYQLFGVPIFIKLRERDRSRV